MMKKQNQMVPITLPLHPQKRLPSCPWSQTPYLSQNGRARLPGLPRFPLITQTIAVTNPHWLSPPYQILFPDLGPKVWT